MFVRPYNQFLNDLYLILFDEYIFYVNIQDFNCQPLILFSSLYSLIENMKLRIEVENSKSRKNFQTSRKKKDKQEEELLEVREEFLIHH